MYIIDPVELANKLAINDIESAITKKHLEKHCEVIHQDEIHKKIFSTDGEINPEYFEDYRDAYDFYFELITNNKNQEDEN